MCAAGNIRAMPEAEIPPVWRTCDKAGTPFFLRTQPRVASHFKKQVIVLVFEVCYNNTRIRIQKVLRGDSNDHR